MKILVAIADYGGRPSLKLVKKCFENSIFDVRVFSTHDGDFIFNHSIGEDLPFMNRQYFSENISKYDYFFYTENDIIYNEYTLKFVLDNFDAFGENNPLGFIRYEDGGQLIDIAASIDWNMNILKEINEKFFRLQNDHQASYLLSRKQLEKCLESGNYLIQPSNRGTYGKLETGASNVYFECGLQKTYPTQGYENLYVKHYDIKWTHMQKKFNFLDLKNLISSYHI
jgi:hypothetical protein